MTLLGRWVGQFRALWDNAGQLVELREELLALGEQHNALVEQVARIEERTRKQDYRARKADEAAYFTPPANGASPVGGKAELFKRAKALGITR